MMASIAGGTRVGRVCSVAFGLIARRVGRVTRIAMVGCASGRTRTIERDTKGAKTRFIAPAYGKFESISLHRRVCELSVPERRTRHLRSGLCARRHFLFAAVQSVHRGLVTLQVLLSSPVVLVVVDELRIDIPGGFIGAFGVQILVLFGVRLARIGASLRPISPQKSAAPVTIS